MTLYWRALNCSFMLHFIMELINNNVVPYMYLYYVYVYTSYIYIYIYIYIHVCVWVCLCARTCACLSKHGSNGGQAPYNLKLETRWKWVVSQTTWALYWKGVWMWMIRGMENSFIPIGNLTTISLSNSLWFNHYVNQVTYVGIYTVHIY